MFKISNRKAILMDRADHSMVAVVYPLIYKLPFSMNIPTAMLWRIRCYFFIYGTLKSLYSRYPIYQKPRNSGNISWEQTESQSNSNIKTYFYWIVYSEHLCVADGSWMQVLTREDLYIADRVEKNLKRIFIPNI